MSQENVERMRKIVVAFNDRDVEAMVAFTDPDVEAHSTFAAVGGAVYHGHAGVRRWHQELNEVFPGEIAVEAEAYFDLGDSVVVYLVLRGRGAQSGAQVEAPIAQIHTFRDGRVVRWTSFIDRREAWTEAGVTAEECERIEP
jgi:ketosteroid isomerase-like protein